MTSKYFTDLEDQMAKARYLAKLTVKNVPLPDPLDEAIRPFAFSTNYKLWPSVSFGNIYMYLIERECIYSREKFENYKSLDAYNYFFSGKVKNIMTFRNTSIDACVVTCEVQASQALHVIHRPWVVTSISGTVYSGHCTCMAGLGEVCGHVAALLFALEVATREGPPSVTSLPMEWNKCAKKVMPEPVVDITFSRKREKNYKEPSQKTFQMPSTSAYNRFLEIIEKNVPSAEFLNMLSDEDTSTSSEAEMELNKVDTCNTEAISKEPLSNTKERIPNLMDFYKKLSRRLPKNIDVNSQTDFFFHQSCLSKDDICEIEIMTRGQNKSPLWSYYRMGRITASLFGRILKCTEKGRANLISKILQEQSNFCNEAMKYGKKTEDIARGKIKQVLEEQHVNLEILPTGFQIDEKFGFLGATPDGLIICDCCDSALLEIKCPYKGVNRNVKDIAIKNFFLDKDGNLKQNHPYFDQVQGQMDILKISKCYFVTYTNVDIKYEIIDYDFQYWAPRKKKN